MKKSLFEYFGLNYRVVRNESYFCPSKITLIDKHSKERIIPSDLYGELNYLFGLNKDEVRKLITKWSNGKLSKKYWEGYYFDFKPMKSIIERYSIREVNDHYYRTIYVRPVVPVENIVVNINTTPDAFNIN